MKRVIIVASFLVMFCSLPVFAWHTNTHLQMTRDAVLLMPPDLQQMFIDNIKFMQPGIKDPDGLLRDYQNHYYLPMTKEGGALDRIDKIIPIILTKLKSGNSADAVKQYCYLAHYVADLWTPEALVRQDQGPNNAYVLNTAMVVLFEGYDGPIENYRKYFEQRCNWRWTIEGSESLYSLLYSEAVNDIARTWLSVWQQSGKNVQPIGSLIIDHPKGSFQTSYEELPPQDVKAAGGGSARPLAPLFKTPEEKEQWEQQHQSAAGTEQRNVAAEGAAIARSRLALQAMLNPPPGFTILESSLRTVGNKAFFVTRIRNTGTKTIKLFAMSYNGAAKPFIEIQEFQPGDVAKVTALLPPNATRTQIQYRYSEK